MSNEKNIINRRFNFNKTKHIISSTQSYPEKPIDINIQNININQINYYNNDNNNNENSNNDNQRKLPKIINNNEIKGRNLFNYFNKTSGLIGFNKGLSYNSLKDLSENNNPQLKFKRLKIIEKKNLIEENNDSFIDELTDILNDVNNNKNINQQQIILEDSKDNLNNSINNEEENKSEDDIEPDPRINFEHINQLNQKRPQTSYGGLNTRRKNLQTALKGKQNLNQPNFNHNNNK